MKFWRTKSDDLGSKKLILSFGRRMESKERRIEMDRRVSFIFQLTRDWRIDLSMLIPSNFERFWVAGPKRLNRNWEMLFIWMVLRSRGNMQRGLVMPNREEGLPMENLLPIRINRFLILLILRLKTRVKVCLNSTECFFESFFSVMKTDAIIGWFDCIFDHFDILWLNHSMVIFLAHLFYFLLDVSFYSVSHIFAILLLLGVLVGGRIVEEI